MFMSHYATEVCKCPNKSPKNIEKHKTNAKLPYSALKCLFTDVNTKNPAIRTGLEVMLQLGITALPRGYP